VGQFPPNAWGLCDMHGNAFEWCQDEWFPNYLGAPSDGSARVTGDIGAEHVVRGGSFWSYPQSCRSAYRTHCGHADGHYHFGFRVVRSLD
jgi:formylglycine-generating enzyme required for sulfatase activity